MIKPIFFLLALCFLSSAAMARPERVSRVKDGDTFELVRHRVFGNPTAIRVIGVDTPEHDWRAKCPLEKQHGIDALKFATEMLAAAQNTVWLGKRKTPDKYGGRYNAKVTLLIGGQRVDWAAALIANGYGLPYDGEGKKPDWCGILAARAQEAQTLPIDNLLDQIRP